MTTRTLIGLLSLTLGTAALTPAATQAAASGTDRPLLGSVSGTTVADLATGTGTEDLTARLSHLGATTIHVDLNSIAVTGNNLTAAATSTLTAANGDKLFGDATAVGVFISTTTLQATFFVTIVGGSGRFADANGHFTVTDRSVIVSKLGATITADDTATIDGQLSY